MDHLGLVQNLIRRFVADEVFKSNRLYHTVFNESAWWKGGLIFEIDTKGLILRMFELPDIKNIVLKALKPTLECTEWTTLSTVEIQQAFQRVEDALSNVSFTDKVTSFEVDNNYESVCNTLYTNEKFCSLYTDGNGSINIWQTRQQPDQKSSSSKMTERYSEKITVNIASDEEECRFMYEGEQLFYIDNADIATAIQIDEGIKNTISQLGKHIQRFKRTLYGDKGRPYIGTETVVTKLTTFSKGENIVHDVYKKLCPDRLCPRPRKRQKM